MFFSFKFVILMSVFPCLQKAMPMRLLTVGKKRSRGTQLLVEEYKEKLGYYCDFEDTLIRSNPKLTRYTPLSDPPTLKAVDDKSIQAIHCSVHINMCGISIQHINVLSFCVWCYFPDIVRVACD